MKQFDFKRIYKVAAWQIIGTTLALFMVADTALADSNTDNPVPPPPPPAVSAPTQAPVKTGTAKKNVPAKQVFKTVPWQQGTTSAVLRVSDRYTWGIEAGPVLYLPMGDHLQDIADLWQMPDIKGNLLTGIRALLFFRPKEAWQIGVAVQTGNLTSNPVNVVGFERVMSVSDRWGGLHGSWRWHKGKWSLSPVLEAGIGSMTIGLSQFDSLESAPSWDDTLLVYRSRFSTGTFERSLSAGYFGIHPAVSGSYRILKWLDLKLWTSWRLVYLPEGSYRASTWNARLPDSPFANISGFAGSLLFVFHDTFLLD